MNIFILDEDPKKAAEFLCDKHIVKMAVETAQLACSAYPRLLCLFLSASDILFGWPRALNKHTHINHPCAKWARESKQNYLWLIEHGFEICRQYELVYSTPTNTKIHKSKQVIKNCFSYIDFISFQQEKQTQFVQAIPDYIKSSNPVRSYRLYYILHKSEFAKWKNRRIPQWFINH